MNSKPVIVESKESCVEEMLEMLFERMVESCALALETIESCALAAVIAMVVDDTESNAETAVEDSSFTELLKVVTIASR